jgi:alpha-tubulin suppressor-like RCC1 family protein
MDAEVAPDADTTTFDSSLDAMGSDAGPDATPADAALDASDPNDAMLDSGIVIPTLPVVPTSDLSSLGSHTCVVRAGALSCWGENVNGELGIGDVNVRTTSVQVALPTGGAITQVTAGEGHTCAIEQGTGALYCWGRNDFGQLGLGDRNPRNRPTLVTGLSRVVQVSAGYGFTCAIDADNALWCWGDNAESQLSLDAWQPDMLLPARSGIAVDWIQISAGQGRTCGLRSPGSLWCVGRNAFYGFGLGNNVPNQYGAWTQSGVEADWTRVSVSQDAACGLRSGSGAYCWGTFATNPITVLVTPLPLGLANWIHGSAGVFNACGVLQTHAIVCWGRNAEGQLGRGDILDSDGSTSSGTDTDWSTVTLGRFHTCAQKLNGTVYCAGENAKNELGLGDTQRRNVFTQVPLP